MRHAKRQAMAQDAAQKKRKERGRSLALIRGLAAFAFVGCLGFAGYQLLVHPGTPLPPQWNQTQPLVISQPVTPFTSMQLNRAVSSPDACLVALDGFLARLCEVWIISAALVAGKCGHHLANRPA